MLPGVSRDVIVNIQCNHAEYLILPENDRVPPDVLAKLGHPQRVYRDAYSSVYRLALNSDQARRY